MKEKERKKAASEIYRVLNKQGILILQDFAIGDFREKELIKKSKVIESHTYKKENEIIAHYFTKKELISLFRDFSKRQIHQTSFSPIHKKPTLKRKLISGIFTK